MRKIDVKKNFGATVKAWRNQRGYSQENLAERADLHRTYVSSVERGARNISLENIEKLASALEITVPALFLQAEVQKPNGSNKKNGHGANFVEVLLVEDNPDDVAMTLHAFKKARLTNPVHVVADGAEALDYLFRRGKYAHRRVSEHPQMVLLDLNLPKVSGLEVLRRIKADKKTRGIPVVVLTTSQKDSDVAQCQSLGAETYIVKPVNFERLSRATPQLSLDWALLKPPMTGPKDSEHRL